MKLQDHDHDLEIIKAVAQAWHAQSSNSRPMTDFEAHHHLNNTFKRKPSRFSLEAIRQKKDYHNNVIGTRRWDLHHSLFDAYEIVSVSKRLESGLVLDHQFSALGGEHAHASAKRRKESKNSLRSLFKLY